MSSRVGLGAAWAHVKERLPTRKSSQRAGICMGGHDLKMAAKCSMNLGRFVGSWKPLRGCDFPLDHQTLAAMIPRLIPPETAKIHYARKFGKHNLDNLLLYRPVRPIPLRSAPLRHRLSFSEKSEQAAAT